MITIIIPARLASTRLPNKPLALIQGVPMIVLVVRRVVQWYTDWAQNHPQWPVQICVATDHTSIGDAVLQDNTASTAGVCVQYTESALPSGTARLVSASQSLPSSSIYINVQGDEPFFSLEDLTSLAYFMCLAKKPCLATLACTNTNWEDFISPHVVKVVTDNTNQALYFSRSPIPYHTTDTFVSFQQHIGIYAYHADFLPLLGGDSCQLALSESLEQLNFLHNQYPLYVLPCMQNTHTKGIDTPDDLWRANQPVFTVPTRTPRFVWQALEGAASDRKFYRVTDLQNTQNTNHPSTSICMAFPSFTGGYGGDPMGWLYWQKTLSQYNIPVPAVYHVDKEALHVWIQDIGDTPLLHVATNIATNIATNLDAQTKTSTTQTQNITYTTPIFIESAVDIYKRVLDQLISIQSQTPLSPSPLSGSVASPHLCFDPSYCKNYTQDLFTKESFLFLNYFVKRWLNINLTTQEQAVLEQELVWLSYQCSLYPQAYCHRDFHSENIMVHGPSKDKTYWIDFQDAGYGPRAYDVASLLRDCYVSIPPVYHDALLEYYIKKAAEHDIIMSHTEYQTIALQRSVKVLGIFPYLYFDRKKNKYANFIPHAVQVVLDNTQLESQYPTIFTYIRKSLCLDVKNA
jgi:3-deoxy-manno-octulosonate cytidylyltransferase (CMP-KDO synthetase)